MSPHPPAPSSFKDQWSLLQALVEGISDPFNLLDRKFRIVLANQARARKHLRRPEELPGQHCYRMFQRRSSICPGCPVQEAFRSGRPCLAERFVDRPDGRRWGEVRAYPLHDRQGRVLYVAEYALDVTQRKLKGLAQERSRQQLEKRLAQQGSRLQEALDQLLGPEPTPEQTPPGGRLSPRELEVLRLAAQGLSNPHIASRLGISSHTVRTHLDHVMDKLGVSSRIQAAVWAAKQGLT